jgi:CHASE2 domain-containing sensor protein
VTRLPPLWVTLAAAVLAAVATLARPWPLADVDLRVYDSLVRADRSDPSPHVRSAIVAIDEPSLSRLGQWPWPRAVLAALVARLDALGATAVAFDVLLAEPERGAAGGDAQLAGALGTSRVVIGHAFLFNGGPGTPDDCIRHPIDLVERQRGPRTPTAGLFEATGGICARPELAAAAEASGFINAIPDPDGVLRRAPLVVRLDGHHYPSLALAAARLAAGGHSPVLEHRSDGSLLLTIGTRGVALDGRARLLVRAARPVDARTPVSAADVIDERVDRAKIEGRVVFIGATALGLRDSVVTASTGGLPGVMVHAAIADTLLGAPAYERTEFAGVTEITVAAVAAVVTGWLAARAGLLLASILGVVLVGGAWWAAGLLLADVGWFVSPLWPSAGVAIALGCEGAATVVRERWRADREQRRRADAQRLIVQTLTTLTETRDANTGQHARRTQALTGILAAALARHPAYRRELTPDRVALIATLAPLHDIGKVGIPDAVLRKPGSLTPEEYAEIQRHPRLGHDSLLKAEALAGVHDDEVIALAKEIVYTHHERWDGAGYPRGLRGPEIPLSGRLVALVDTYDALVSDRAYQEAVSHEHAVQAIRGGSGRHFDPDIVEAFLSIEDRIRAVAFSTGPDAPAGSPVPDAR